jgi:hypothetical protein
MRLELRQETSQHYDDHRRSSTKYDGPSGWHGRRPKLLKNQIIERSYHKVLIAHIKLLITLVTDSRSFFLGSKALGRYRSMNLCRVEQF